MEYIFFKFLDFWFITVPIFIYLIYVFITELLDLVINTRKVKKLLKQFDSLNIESLETEYLDQKAKKDHLNFIKLKILEDEIHKKSIINGLTYKSAKKIFEIFKA